jgi:MYXO-CTERM domain-containing protein
VVAGNNGSSNNLFAESIAGIAIGPSGEIYVSEATGTHTIYTVGPGTATPLTSAVTAPQGLAFGNGNLFAVSGFPSDPLVASINPTTGNTTTVSDNNGAGSGPAYGSLRGIAIGSSGSLYVTDVETNTIYLVDPADGSRVAVSGGGVGGTTFGGLTYGIAIYPSASSAPEPGSAWLPTAGIVGLLAWRRG